MDKKKIAIITSSMSLGGITSFVIGLSNYLVGKGHSVDLYYSGGLKEKLDLLDEKVNCVFLKRQKKRSFKRIINYVFKGCLPSILKIKFRDHKKSSPIGDIQRLTRVDALCEKMITIDCDVAISASEFFCNDFLAFRVNAPHKIGWIHPDISKLNLNKKLLGQCIEKLDRVVAVSEQCENSLRAIFPEFEEKFISIENILPQEMVRTMAQQEIDDVEFSENVNIVTVARIDNSSKRFDRVVTACKFFTEKGATYHWYIIGEGADLPKIKQLAEELKVTENVTFLGARTNPYPYVKKADVFVLTSHYEGRPIAVDEALALHCPCVVTNYKSAKEQVNENYGRVIDNNDDTVSQELFDAIFSSNNLSVWKNNLETYEFDNSKSHLKIDELLK